MIRWLRRGLAGTVVLGLVVAVLWARGTLPRVDGTVRVAGLSGPVEIVRDRHGVPHISARSEADAYFALGYVHAQDRLWQMEVNRRIAAGRLAEIFGAGAVASDRFLRTLGLHRVARRTVANLEPGSRALIEAYAAGINAFLASTRGGLLPAYLSLPPEFLIFRHVPEPWRAADSIGLTKIMAWDLGGNWGSELLRARLSRHLGNERVAEFLPPYPGDDPIPLPDMEHFYAALPLDDMAATLPAPARGNGSNNWVVSGKRSVTGKPLLANDPHLGLSTPSVWYLAHLRAPGLNVIGATLPGVPGVVLGRNDRIAWGMTNTGPDVQDLYVERVVPGDGASYAAPDGPRAFEVRDEVIKVRDGEDVVFQVRSTRHGPVISDVSRGARAAAGEGYVMALAWTALREDDLTVQAGPKIARAGDWAAFVEALRDYHAPQQSMVYADVDGNIGLYAPGRVPLRKADNDLHGLMPAPGWDGRYDWRGFIPFEELPHRFNPPAGVIFTANDKIVPASYPHFITSEWAPPYRARRIAELLDARPRHSIESFKALQGDLRSGMADDLLSLMLAAQPPDEDLAETLDALRAWDGDMGRNRPEPLIFAAWYRELTRALYADELGPMFRGSWGFRPAFVRNALTGRNRWCDDVNTAEVESCASRVALALGRALAQLRAAYGDDMWDWRWGEPHYALSDHRPFSRFPLLGRLFDVRLPAGGDPFTVNAARHNLADAETPFVQVHGPSLRAIYDLGTPDRALFIHSTGQSGNVFSRHYRDLAEPWRDVRYISTTTDPDAPTDRAEGTLNLIPALPAPGAQGEQRP